VCPRCVVALIGMDDFYTTVAGLIQALGGATRAAEALGENDPRVVSNWKMRGKLPSHRYLAHREILNRIGIRAADHLWFEAEGPSAQ
jgi:hypothetical protein